MAISGQEREANGQYGHVWSTVEDDGQTGPMTSGGVRYWGTICYHCGKATELEPGETVSAAERRAFVARTKS